MVTPTLSTLLVPCDDLDAALAFYGGTLGLSSRYRDGDRFAALRHGELTIALAAPKEHLAPDTTLMCFRTSDLDGSIASLTQAGATLVRPTVTGAHEVSALLVDPGGARFSVYAPSP